jgi:hypothetical protein
LIGSGSSTSLTDIGKKLFGLVNSPSNLGVEGNQTSGAVAMPTSVLTALDSVFLDVRASLGFSIVVPLSSSITTALSSTFLTINEVSISGGVVVGPLSTNISLGGFELDLIDASFLLEVGAQVPALLTPSGEVQGPTSVFIPGRSVTLLQMIAAGGFAPFANFIVGLPWQPIGRLDASVSFDASYSGLSMSTIGYPMIRVSHDNLFDGTLPDIMIDLDITPLTGTILALLGNFTALQAQLSNITFNSDMTNGENSSIANQLESFAALSNFALHSSEYFEVAAVVQSTYSRTGTWPSFRASLFTLLQAKYGSNKYPSIDTLDYTTSLTDIVLIFYHTQTNQTMVSMFGHHPTFDGLCQLLFGVPTFKASLVFGPKPTLRSFINYLKYRAVSATIKHTLRDSLFMTLTPSHCCLRGIQVGHCVAPVNLQVTFDISRKEVRFDVVLASSAHIASQTMGNALASFIGDMKSALGVASGFQMTAPHTAVR